MTKTVDAIVRGPQPYFGADGVIYAPGDIVRGVPADEVSTEAFREIEVEVEARNGDLRKRTVSVWSLFFVDAHRTPNDRYVNPSYVHRNEVLRPSTTLMQMKLWTEYYLRYQPGMQAKTAG